MNSGLYAFVKAPCKRCQSFDHIRYKIDFTGMHRLWCDREECTDVGYGIRSSSFEEAVDTWNKTSQESKDE